MIFPDWQMQNYTNNMKSQQDNIHLLIQECIKKYDLMPL